MERPVKKPLVVKPGFQRADTRFAMNQPSNQRPTPAPALQYFVQLEDGQRLGPFATIAQADDEAVLRGDQVLRIETAGPTPRRSEFVSVRT